jgi:hypothetical protein
MKRKGDWMQTWGGGRYWPLDPQPDDMNIADISAALGNLCRFGGHTKRFYSVAEHCILISQAVPKEFALWGLLHDASEAYLGDMVKPLKDGSPEYKALEDKTMRAVVTKFNLSPNTMPEEIKKADMAILKNEQMAMMHPCPYDWWCIGEEPLKVVIHGWSPSTAALKFLYRFNDIRQNQHPWPPHMEGN